jgi:hypothetical protein
MIRLFFFIFTFSFIEIGFAQVGINTKTPLASFHIDGKGDNSAVPTNVQTANDFVVTSDGYVGIGTISPTVNLEIKTKGMPGSVVEGFRLVDGSEGIGKFLVSDSQGIGSWKSAIITRLSWDSNHKFTIPYTGIYLITLYLDDNNTTNAYTNKWTNPPLDNGTLFNGVALFSETRGNYLISNSNSTINYGVSCSGTLVLNAGEVVRPGALAWMSTSTRILGVEIIPL